MNDQDSGSENKNKGSVLQLRIKFFRLLPYIAAFMIRFALIASFAYADYAVWIWTICIISIPMLTAWESKFLVIDLLEHGIRVRRL